MCEHDFVAQVIEAGVPDEVAKFVWDEFKPYYFAPLTPYPEDRPISEMRIDSDDLSEIEVRFERRFGRKWVGKWIGSDDPTLIEFAHGMLASTSER